LKGSNKETEKRTEELYFQIEGAINKNKILLLFFKRYLYYSQMGYKNLQQCILDLEKCAQLIRVKEPVNPYLEMALIQRMVYANKGPALLFENPIGCSFPMLGNLFGTIERTNYIFRDTLNVIEKLVKLKINPMNLIKEPASLIKMPIYLKNLLPKKVHTAPILEKNIKIEQLPHLVSWEKDGGAFITLPQVYSESPLKEGFKNSNLGMYRIQISGNEYEKDEVGIHYQIHRGIGIHHTEAIDSDTPLKVNVFVGGAPAMTIAAVMPLPEGMPEVYFAGLLAGHRIPFIKHHQKLPVYAEADFCLSGYIVPELLKPEGPFGDHLGYYSLTHNFPVIKVEKVYCRKNAVWPFTTVGRPPQEDTSFGKFIHDLTGELIPQVLPGVKAVHAVDAAGVHPLLLALGSERYVPYSDNKRPLELLTLANAILGQGQLSLAKYLFISTEKDMDNISVENVKEFFIKILEITDFRTDLHFQTSTTIDTLDYTGESLNIGSKLIIASTNRGKKKLTDKIPENLTLPEGFHNPKVICKGILAIKGPKAKTKRGKNSSDISKFVRFFKNDHPINQFPLIVITDDSEFVAANFDNFLWVTFTRSNPATDIYGIDSYTKCKHWGCKGSLVIDARIKPFHAPPLEDNPEVMKKVKKLFEKGKSLYGII
jgi:4-hydroxy-3-polyprenylbenzoate decarboxylase